MEVFKARIPVQKHCEVLSIQPDEKETDAYYVRVLLTKEMEEFAPEVPLHLKGSPKQIAQILSFLGEKYAESHQLENALDDLSIAPLSLEVKEGRVVATGSRGQQVFQGGLPADVQKTQKTVQKHFQPASVPSNQLLSGVEKIRSVWSEINMERTSKEKRVAKKMTLLEDFIRQLARQKGIPEEEIAFGLAALKESSSINDFLNRARLQYFPALDHDLHALQSCEECKDHLVI